MEVFFVDNFLFLRFVMYTPVIGTLGYILSPDGKQGLMVHRNGRADDHHFGKYNGPGGKMHAGEDVAVLWPGHGPELNGGW